MISNLLTGDETWVHMFEPQRRSDNKQLGCKDQKRPFVARRTILVDLLLFLQALCVKTKKVKTKYEEKRPSKDWLRVHLIHDNAPSHKSEVVKTFIVSENVNAVNRPPYSPDHSPCDFFFVPKKMLSGRTFSWQHH